MRPTLNELKWRAPEDARRARAVLLILLGGLFIIDFLVWMYWHSTWKVINGLGIWTFLIALGGFELFGINGWIRGWRARNEQGPR